MNNQDKNYQQFKKIEKLHNDFVQAVSEVEIEGIQKNSVIRYVNAIKKAKIWIASKMKPSKPKSSNPNNDIFKRKTPLIEEAVEEVIEEKQAESSVLADTGDSESTLQEKEEAKESARKKSRLSKADKNIVAEFNEKGLTAEEIAEKQNYSLKAVEEAIKEL